MSTQKPIPVARILQKLGLNGHMKCAPHVSRLAELESMILPLLPKDVIPHCRVAGLSDGCLRLLTTSPVWAARLRFQSALLVQQLRRQGTVTVRTVQVRISPLHGTNQRVRGKIRLSTENARLLQQTAAAMQDERLAQALLRLARRAGSPTRD